MSRLAKTVVIALSVMVFSYAGLGYVLGKSDDDKTLRSLTVYGEVLQRVQEDYVDEPNLSVVTAGALHGLLESLDPYSGYLSPREYADYKDKEKAASQGEVGATLAKAYGYIVVVSVIPDGPAEKAGLRTGDILEAIAGFTTRDMSVGQANVLLNGSAGSSVTAGVVHPPTTEPKNISILRESVPTLHLTADKVDDGVAYIRVPAFNTGEANELRDKLQQFSRQGIHKLVLDLRNCASGPVSEGVSAAQLFVPSGTIAALGGQTISRQEFTAAPNKVAWNDPVEVLISDSTSGAAEVVAAAIGDNHRGDLVGGRTFGSASEQKLIPLEDGSAITLTVAYYYTPSGKTILGQGIAPTVEVNPIPADNQDADNVVTPAPLSANQLPPATDPVYHKALDILKNGLARPAAFHPDTVVRNSRQVRNS